MEINETVIAQAVLAAIVNVTSSSGTRRKREAVATSDGIVVTVSCM